MKTIMRVIAFIFLILAISQTAMALPWVFPSSTGNEPVNMMLLGTLLIALGSVARKRLK